MLSLIFAKARRAFTVVCFGLLILRWCGLRMFISKTLHQLSGRTFFLVTTGQLDNPLPPSSFQCTTSLASPDDVEELFGKLYHESREGRYQLLVRRWYHERGLGDCYVNRATDTNEICVVRWIATSKHIKRLGWEDRFPLDEDEVMGENIYTFERYRREGARAAGNLQVIKIVQQQGYKRTRGYTDETDIRQLKWGEKAGTQVCARILERHFLFRVTRKTLERYDPPIRMTAPPDS